MKSQEIYFYFIYFSYDKPSMLFYLFIKYSFDKTAVAT